MLTLARGKTTRWKGQKHQSWEKMQSRWGLLRPDAGLHPLEHRWCAWPDAPEIMHQRGNVHHLVGQICLLLLSLGIYHLEHILWFFALSQLQIQRLEKMHLVLWEAGGRDVPIFSKSREASWDMPHSGAKPKKFKIIGFVFNCVQFCIILFDCVQLFSALSQGTQWVGDNPRDSEDSPPITNSKTFVTRDLAVKMTTRGRLPTSNENMECIGIVMDDSSF